LGELQRRNVFRVAAAYAVIAWLLLQVTDVLGPILDLPDWVARLVLYPDRKTGLGDIELLHIFVPHLTAGFSWGVGAEFTFPTAGQSVNGDEKWVAGPAAYVMFKRGARLQIGAIARERISFAGKSSRDDIHELVVQPILQYNLDDGWYVSMGDFDWKFDWKDNGAATIPAAFQVGKVADIGGKLFNLSLEYGYYVARHGPNPNYSIRLGFSRLLPRK
jgi:hypothetical protein